MPDLTVLKVKKLSPVKTAKFCGMAKHRHENAKFQLLEQKSRNDFSSPSLDVHKKRRELNYLLPSGENVSDRRICSYYRTSSNDPSLELFELRLDIIRNHINVFLPNLQAFICQILHLTHQSFNLSIGKNQFPLLVVIRL